MNTNEPAVISTTIAAAISAVALLVFKEELSQEVTAAIVAVVTLLAGFWTRSKVQPVA